MSDDRETARSELLGSDPMAVSKQKSRDEILWGEYTEVVKSHSGITEFRSKLLGFLPLVSGAGISLLLNDQTDATRLIALGLFGSIITLGLFLHERQNIRRCWDLVKRGKTLENDLKLDKGQFTMEYMYEMKLSPLRQRLWRHMKIFVDTCKKFPRLSKSMRKFPKGTHLASWVIYISVLLAWLSLAGVGMCQSVSRSESCQLQTP